jgi:Holliday junction resolvasome RuvABC endonuclease subunit
MIVLGLRTYKDNISWALVDGSNRETAKVVRHGILQIPSGERGESLAWVRKEVSELVGKERPKCVVICPTEGPTVNNALIERAQVDGVVLEVLHTLEIPTRLKKSASIRAQFGVRSNAQLSAALKELPAVSDIAVGAKRRDPVVGAVSELPIM